MSGPADSVFHEEQRFRLKRMRILLAIPPLSMLMLLIWQVLLGHPWGKHPVSNSSLVFWTIFLSLVYLRLVTVKLVTDVCRGEISLAMRGFWRKRRVALAEVAEVQTVTYDPVRDYGGYGVRTTRRGTAYIAGGNRGVRLKLTSGRVILIGSELAEELEHAIRRCVDDRSNAQTRLATG
ncbi:MAG TPA: hypothetical protein VJN43_05000 [Bryobacteraceae bacterium]|nr:hypothetical protein [Bryobacteraceae bacterium]